jgi:hypothetical protein
MTSQACAAMVIVSAFIQTASAHVIGAHAFLPEIFLFHWYCAMFLVGRTLNGNGVAALNVSVPVYQSRIFPGRQRSRMVGAHSIMIISERCRQTSPGSKDPC